MLYMYHNQGAIEKFIILGCMLVAHIHEGCIYIFKRCILFVYPTLLFMQKGI